MSLPRGVGAVGGEEAALSSRVPIAAGISVDLRIIAARHVDVGVPAQRRHVAANFTAPTAQRAAQPRAMVDVEKKPQIVEHVNKSLTQTVYDTRWIPCSARFVLMGSPPRQTGLIQARALRVAPSARCAPHDGELARAAGVQPGEG